MKHVTFFTFVCLFLTFQFLPAQTPDTLWTRTYGEGVGYCVIETADHDYAIVGGTDLWGNGVLRLIKTNSMGDTVWTKNYEGVGHSVRQTYDGGYIITGILGENVLLLKTNSLGDTIWTKNYDGGGWVYGYSVQQTADSGYIIVGGKTQQYLADQVWLIKTDEIGDSLWTKTYEGLGSGLNCGYSVQQTNDGGYIIAGRLAAFSPGTYSFGLIKTNDIGNSSWIRRHFGAWSCCYSVWQTADSGYIVTGWASNTYRNDVFLMKTNSSGDNLWTKTYGDTILYDIGRSVQQTTDGGYIITGYTESYGAGDKDVWLIKTDVNGDTLWTKTFGGSGEDRGYYVQLTSDGGYIITGDIDGDIWLIKTAPDPLNIEKNEAKVLSDFNLSQNYPNPFNPSTTIEFDLPKTSQVTLKIFNILGEEVATLVSDKLSAGSYSYEWDASNLASGVYLYRLQAGDYVETRKMVLMR